MTEDSAGGSAREQARRARERAEQLNQQADSWERGAEGEAETGRVLAGLGDEWFVLHDLRWPGRRFANIDHLVVGPGGVLVIDSKNWSGELALSRGVLTQNGRKREQALAGAADAALAVAELIPAFARVVQPVICFVRPDELRGESRGVALCSTATLIELVTTRPVVLDRTQADHLRWALDTGTLSAAGPGPRPAAVPGPRPAARATRPRPVRKPPRAARRTSRRGSGGGQLLAALVVIGLFFTAGPWFANQVGPGLTRLIQDAAIQPDPCPPTATSSGPSGGATRTSAPAATATPCPTESATPTDEPTRKPRKKPAGKRTRDRQPVGPN